MVYSTSQRTIRVDLDRKLSVEVRGLSGWDDSHWNLAPGQTPITVLFFSSLLLFLSVGFSIVF
jgi:hypothetical protein